MHPLSVASVITRQVRPTTAVALAVAATAFFLLGPAAGQAEEEPVRLEYHAPPTCDNETQFFARARLRAPQMRIARADERARMFVVDIEQRAGRTSGRLTVRNPEGRQTVREIEARDCNEAVDALALVVALVVNPRASAAQAPPATTADAELNRSGAAPSAPGPPAPAAPSNTPSSPAPESATVAGPSMPSRDASAWAFRAGLGGWGVGAIAPEPLLGGRASAEMLNVADSVIAPSFRASFGYATHAGFVVDGGTAHFAYAGMNLEACPVRVPPAGALVFRPCAMADVGFVFARGSDALNARGATRPWVDIGVGGRLEWSLGRRMGLELDVGCIFPVWRDRFLFGSRAFHRVAGVGGVAALGFLMRIP